jgi:hypothetical protein
LVRSQVLYPAELPAHLKVANYTQISCSWTGEKAICNLAETEGFEPSMQV